VIDRFYITGTEVALFLHRFRLYFRFVFITKKEYRLG
jgi:hypothetical protein